MKIIKFCLLLFCLTCLISCGQINNGDSLQSNVSKTFSNSNSFLAETPPPKTIKELNKQLEQYKPQVEIIFPQEEQVLNQTSVNVQLGIKDLPIFKDEKLNLGNHLNLILDNEPAKQIYDVAAPIKLKDLTPGTHSIRVFATRPWGESFKNDGAFAQISFSVLTETNNNRPDRNLPLLTYNNPTGTYGAEPFLLDFYLTNAPLHSVAKNNPQFSDWQVKATVNGDSFILENWQPIYLMGLNKGENWIQLELIDEAGNNIENAYNNTVRVITYDSQRQDTISKLVTDKISLADAQPIVEQNYYIQPVGLPEIIEPTIEQKEIPETITTSETQKLETSDTALDDSSENSKAETEAEALKVDNNNTYSFNVDSDVAKITHNEISEQPTIIAAPLNQKQKADKIISEIPVEEIDEVSSTESTEPKQTIVISEENSNSPEPEPIAAIEIPQLETIEIADNSIDITIPQTESDRVLETEAQAPSWWKKILVGLRQKLENLVELLPSEV